MLGSSWLEESWQAGQSLGLGLCDDSHAPEPEDLFQLTWAGSGLCREDKGSEWPFSKKEEKEVKKQTNKTQVEKGDFSIKGNKCYERWREVSDDLNLIGSCLSLLPLLSAFWGKWKETFLLIFVKWKTLNMVISPS